MCHTENSWLEAQVIYLISMTYTIDFEQVLFHRRRDHLQIYFQIFREFNSFVPNAPFLCPPENIRNLKIWCFHGVEKGCIGTNGLSGVINF